MAVKYVDDFEFPSSGQTQVRAHSRAAPVKKAMGGIVQPPKSGVRPVRPSNAERAQKYAETMAMRPNRGTRVGAKIATPKAPKTSVPKPSAVQPPMGALQSAPPMAAMPAMAKGGRLTAKSRGALPTAKFAGPDRSYPVPDRSHAANAKARASQAVNAGRMTPAERAKIDAKANAVLKK